MAASDDVDVDDTLVVVIHPFGNLEVTLRWWIETGPGPRPFVRPGRARSRSTGQRLPLTVVPLAYRNTRESRQAIREGLIANPWPHTWRPPSFEEEHQLPSGYDPDGEISDDELGSVIAAYDETGPGVGRHRAV